MLSSIDLSECPEAIYSNGLLHGRKRSVSAPALVFTFQKECTVFTKELSDRDECSKDVESTLILCFSRYITEKLTGGNYHVKMKLTYDSMK